MADKVKVKIKPLKGIGGVGEAGDVVWMTPAEAEMYFRDGYVEYLREAEAQKDKGAEVQMSKGAEVVEDHKIMKPQSKRKK